MNRMVRAIALSIAGMVSCTSVAGCGAAQAVLGIQEPPKANSASARLTGDQAERILSRELAAAQQSEATTGAAAAAALRTAYTGEGLRAARARVKLAGIKNAGADSPFLGPQESRLLAVSRGFGYPRVMVAQTVPSGGLFPILHLLTSPDAATPYRLSASATMLPSSSIKPFDPLGQGSPLTDGNELAVTPSVLLNAYAAMMAFPAKAVANPPFAADAKAAEVRARAAAVAKAVVTQSSFSQVHKVVPHSVYAVRQANGDALVFGVIERTDSFKVKSGQAVEPSDNRDFVRLTGKKLFTKSASITTLEFVVFAVPRSRGQATLVAASEQVVAGSGS